MMDYSYEYSRYDDSEYNNENNASINPNYTNDIYYNDTYYTDYHYYDFVYEGFTFERTVYLYIVQILTIFSVFVNTIIIIIIARSSTWNSTNVVLLAIAVAEIVASLVLVPTYIYVYQRFEKKTSLLSEEWCNTFMLSRYFLSKTFLTVKMWLHCVLGIQRTCLVCFPFKARVYVTPKKTCITIAILCVFAPLLHIYHIFTYEKAFGGVCAWKIFQNTDAASVYLWLKLLLMNIIPCVVVSICTVTMLVMLYKTTKAMVTAQSIPNREIFARRNEQNLKISKTAVSVLIAFLIPEIIYDVYLVYSRIAKQSAQSLTGQTFLFTSRLFHATYDVLIVLSYSTNFWIYIFLNQSFKEGVIKLFHFEKLRRNCHRCCNSKPSSVSNRTTKLHLQQQIVDTCDSEVIDLETNTFTI